MEKRCLDCLNNNKLLQSNGAGPIESICPGSAYSTCPLDFRHRDCARDRLFDDINNDGFDCWSDGLFHSPHGLSHCRAFGLGLSTIRFAAFARRDLRAFPRLAEFPLGSFFASAVLISSSA